MALVVALTLTGLFVWNSPRESLLRVPANLASAITDPTADLRAERDALEIEVASLEARLSEAETVESDLAAELEEATSSLEATDDELAQAYAENQRLHAQMSSMQQFTPAAQPESSDGEDSPAAGEDSPGTGEASPGGTEDSSGSDDQAGGEQDAGASDQDSGSEPSPTPAESESPSPAPSPSPTPEEPAPTAPPLAQLVAPSDPIFGMYTQQAPFNWATYDDTSSRIDYRPNVVGYFGGWDEDFRPHAVTRAWERDTLPILTWESRPISSPNNVTEEPEYSLPLIVDGQFDDYLRQYAQDIVELGLPLGIRLNHEMNGTWYPWSEFTSSGGSLNGNNPGDYVRVWQRVHDIFTEEGANEYVFWIWAPNIINNLPSAHQSQEHLASLYPGDDYVDWVGLSGYLRPPYRDDQDFSFDYTFGRSLEQLRALTGKPIFLAEIGASETGGHKPGWVTSFFEGLAAEENDDILGFAWFNLAITTYVQGQRATNDWRIDSRRDSLDAFREGLLRPDLDYDLAPYE